MKYYFLSELRHQRDCMLRWLKAPKFHAVAGPDGVNRILRYTKNHIE